MNLCIRATCFRQNFISSIYRFSTTPEVTEQNEPVLIEDSDEALAENARIEMKRNKSRLSHGHYNIVNGRMPYDTPQCLAHLTVKYHRKLYGKYGSASGVNPSKFYILAKYFSSGLDTSTINFVRRMHYTGRFCSMYTFL